MSINLYADSLDKIDLRIVELLSMDGRITDTEIAKEVGLSKTSVRLRKLKLIKSEKIKILGIPILQNLNLVYADIMIKFLVNTS
ncbi:MAG: AsnC family transcriptional regulator, partial [Candidatus Thermoplasmatota archaeon]|nr:AsnC family transcriptional regulator [Candidatus Thermoplasmatota archaeon]